jgi:hypothetical protein
MRDVIGRLGHEIGRIPCFVNVSEKTEKWDIEQRPERLALIIAMGRDYGCCIHCVKMGNLRSFCTFL